MEGNGVTPAGGAFGDALIGALEEAVAHARGELPAARVDRVDITARDVRVTPPPAYTAAEVRAIRTGIGVSQQVFADLLNSSASAVRAWEQGQREPDGPSRRLLEIAERAPEALAYALHGRGAAELLARGFRRRASVGPMLRVAEPQRQWGTSTDESTEQKK